MKDRMPSAEYILKLLMTFSEQTFFVEDHTERKKICVKTFTFFLKR